MENQNQNVPNTTTIDQIQSALTQKRQELGQRVAEAPKIYSQYAPEQDQTVSGLRANQADKIRQLFDHDTNLAQTYFQPEAAPAAPGETVPQPEQRIIDPLIGMRAASGQTIATANELADIVTQIGQRKDYLSSERDKTLGLLDRFIQINDREQRALEAQLNLAVQNKKDKVSNALSILGITGGTLPDDVADEVGLPRGTRIPGEVERRAPTQKRTDVIEVDGRTKLIDLDTGEILKDLGIKTSSKELEAQKEMANIVDFLNVYSKKRSGLGTRAVNPYDPLTAEVNTSKDLFSQILGKYIEVGGRGLTDKDRDFYSKQIPGAFYITGSAEGKITGVKNSILSKGGYYEVKEIATGTIGVIPKEEFDKNIYIKLAP